MIRAGWQEPREIITSLFLAIIFGLFACGLLIVFSEFKPIISLALFSGILFVAFAWFSGNVKHLFLLFLIMVVPLDLSKCFQVYPHFGGEWALRLELSDVFLIPLLAFWIKEIYQKKKNLKDIVVPGALVAWGLLIIFSIALLLYSEYRLMATYEIVRMCKMFLLALYIVNTVKSRSLLLQICFMLIAGVFLEALYGVMQSYFNFSLGLEKLGESPEAYTDMIASATTRRIGAMLGHPNMLASYLVLFLPLCLTTLYAAKNRIYRFFCMLTVLSGCLCLLLTLSRGGWLGFACALTIVIFVSLVHPRLRKKAILLRTMTLGIAIIIGFAFSYRIIERFTQSDPGTVSSRYELMLISWQMIKAHPVVGVGLNAFTFVLNNYNVNKIDWMGEMLPPVHNIYLLIFSEQGIIGFSLFLITLLLTFGYIWKNFRSSDDSILWINLGLGAGFCAILIQGLADWTLRANTVHRVFWILLSLIMAVYQYNSKNSLKNCK